MIQRVGGIGTMGTGMGMVGMGACNLVINVEKHGPGTIVRESFPLRYGKYSEVKTSEYEFVFNLNGEIKFIRGLNVDWPHPAEQLKRTDGNDWVYYTVGDDSSAKGIISWLGEYYLPCLPYPSNPIWEVNYFSNTGIMNAFGAWSQLYASLYGVQKDRFSFKSKKLIEDILYNNETVLHERAQELHSIIGGRVSVLPPDTRHVDYEVIPLNISDGCLYHCKFCCVKSSQKFQVRSQEQILDQIKKLKSFYGRNIQNCNAVFLGNHDALQAGEATISFAASNVCKYFDFETNSKKPSLFMFGSVDSFLKCSDTFLENINRLPFHTYINTGLESLDSPTLALIGKPITESKVREAFKKMLHVNACYENIEITGNFVMGAGLSPEHYMSIKELLRDVPSTSKNKGAVYLSPLKDSPKKRELLPLVNEIQNESKVPVYIYLIQRL